MQSTAQPTGQAVTVDRAGRVILAAKILAGRWIRIRIDGSTLMFPGRAPHHHPARP